MPSYIKGSQVIASQHINSASNGSYETIASPYTLVYGSTDWSVGGAGTFVKSNTSQGVSCYVTVDAKWDSANQSNSLYMGLFKNGYMIYRFSIPAPGLGGFQWSGTVPFLVLAEPNDSFTIANLAQSGVSSTTLTNLTIAVSFSSP